MLEYIVRPFTTPNSHGTIVIPSTPHASDETAILTWGGEADLPETQYFETGFNTRKGREDYTENSRDKDTIRIYGEDPGDGPSYIDVDRGNKLYMDKETGRAVQADTPGQSDYVVGALADDPAFEPLSPYPAIDPTKTKATLKLKN